MPVAWRGSLAEPDEAGGAPTVGTVRAPRHLVGGVALDRVDRAARVDGLDDADVAAAPDDQVAGLRRLRARRVRLAGLLGPAHDVRHGAEALALVADRHARLAGGPRGEVRAPRADAGAGGGL